MNKITLGTTYYENPECLSLFIQNHIAHVDELVIVDDGSIKHPIENYLRPTDKIKIYKVTKDYGFNSHGCRNLIAKQASNDFILFLDIDRKIEYIDKSLQKLKAKSLDEMTLYKFTLLMPQYDNIRCSINDFLINKKLFNAVGGYDEEFIGMRWGDREFIAQCNLVKKERLLSFMTVSMTRGESMYDDSAIISDNEIKLADTREQIVKDFAHVYQRLENLEPNKPTLTFEWGCLCSR